MENIFIGWGGNKPLADKLELLIDGNGYNGIVGGGLPTDMHVGKQVLTQIDKCSRAILLFEKIDGAFRENLLYEQGYISARMQVKNVHVFMIDCKLKDLPSDLSGIWGTEIVRGEKSDEELAAEIYAEFEKTHHKEKRRCYFDLINEWPTVCQLFSDSALALTERQIAENTVLGCLAAYYYSDIKFLNQCIDKVEGSEELELIMQFAETYNNVFLKSNNMATCIDVTFFSRAVEVFERTLQRKIDKTDNFQLIIDMLCYDVYGLSCLLYLKNETVEDEEANYCREQARECFTKTIALSEELEKALPNDPCLIKLIRAYIYNDAAHLFLNHYNDEAQFLKYLELSVKARRELYLDFHSHYPGNSFLESKLEQEYYVALCEQCLYMPNDFNRKMQLSRIRQRYRDWKEEAKYTFSLLNRLENNLSKIDAQK